MDDSQKKILFNTGTFFDLMSGKYEVGVNNHHLLNGGLGTFVTALHGRGNTYKSTLMDSFIVGILRSYSGIKCFAFDTEYSKDKTRMASFMSDVRFGHDPVLNQISLKSDPSWTTEKTWKFISKICKEREKHRKELMVTTPFLDLDLKPIQLMLPTIIFIDSWSELRSAVERDFFEDDKKGAGIEDKKFRTLHMEDGNKKTFFMGALNEYTNQYGVIVTCTARTGNNQSMDNAPPRKELTHQRQGDKIKNVGSKFTTLTHMLTQVMSCRNCVDSSKEAMYKFGDTSAMDLQELEVAISRNKMNPSGLIVPFVVSQSGGLLNDVSYLNFLRRYGKNGTCPGLIGSGRPSYASSWLPEVKFTRNNVREKLLDNYKLSRALELSAKYQFIKISWNTSSLPFDMKKSPEEVFDNLVSSGAEMDDILESTSIWAPLPDNKIPKVMLGSGGRTYMSLFDILSKVS